jgi:Arm DNA-binding domain
VTELGLGSAALLSLQEARDEANDYRKAVRKGEDPVEQKRDRRRTQITFAEMVSAFIAVKQPGWRSASHWETMRRLLNDHASRLAAKSVSTMTADDIEAAVRPLWCRSPDLGKRTLSAISQVFDYAVSKGHCVINPADWRRMKYRFPNHRAVVKHFTAMDYTEVPDFVGQLRAEQSRKWCVWKELVGNEGHGFSRDDSVRRSGTCRSCRTTNRDDGVLGTSA